MVQGVYILERDRQEKRQGCDALAPRWWEFCHFRLLRQLVDDVDSSIFGAVYEYKPLLLQGDHKSDGSPRYVIAFRGTLTKPDSLSRDIELDLHLIQNGLHRTSRFEIAMQVVRNMVATVGDSNLWLAGHSLGSAMAMLAGKTLARTSIFLKSYLFNPPFFSPPIERIKDKNLKHGLRFAGSVITAGLAFALKARSNTNNNQRNPSEEPFFAIAAWVPFLFVNPSDHIGSEYIGYFQHREKMEDIGAGSIERLATQNSIGGLLLNAIGRDTDPLHLIPSASLITNLSPAQDFKQAHGIHQWWQPHLQLQSKIYKYT